MKDSQISNDMCRLCGKQSETIQVISSSCEKLVATEYKERHDSMAKVLHSAFAKKRGLQEETTPYWEYQLREVDENEEAEILRDRTAYTYKKVMHIRPDIILKDKRQRKAYLIDIAEYKIVMTVAINSKN